MSEIKNMPYLGVGEIFLKEWGVAGPLLPFGNCQECSIGVSPSSNDQRDYRSEAGGLAASIPNIDEMTISIVNLSLSPKNIAMAVFGVASEEAAAAVTDETHTAYADGFIPFQYLPDSGETVTVTIDPEGTPTVAEAGTDYILRRTGIVIQPGGAISDGDTISIGYTKSPSWAIQALMNSGKQWQVVYDGVNKATGKAVGYTFHKVQFNATDNLALLGDDFANLPFNGKVLSDDSVVGQGLSKFFRANIGV